MSRYNHSEQGRGLVHHPDSERSKGTGEKCTTERTLKVMSGKKWGQGRVCRVITVMAMPLACALNDVKPLQDFEEGTDEILLTFVKVLAPQWDTWRWGEVVGGCGCTLKTVPTGFGDGLDVGQKRKKIF